jgi:3-isopropylmalate dehydratase small subunit
MEAFKTFRGVVATLERANVDTDQIIPKQFLSPSSGRASARRCSSTGAT